MAAAYQDPVTAIPAASKAFAQSNPNATVAQQANAGLLSKPAVTSPIVQPGTTTPTVVTDANIRENTLPQIQSNAQKVLQQRTNANPAVSPVTDTSVPSPTVVPGNGSTTPAPVTTPSTTQPAPSTTPTNDYDSFLKSLFDENQSTGTQGVAPANDPYLLTLSTLKATSDAATQTLIASTQQQFAQRKAQMAATNAAGSAGLMQSLISNGEARYAPLLAGQTLTADEQAGVTSLSSIDADESSAVAQLQKAQADQDFQTMGKYLDHLDSLRTEKINVATKLSEDAATATKALNDAVAKVQSDKNAVVEELAKAGAPADVIAAATASPDAAGAISAGAGYFQDPTSTAGQYAAYVQATKAKGLTPMTPGDFLAKQKSSDAYSSAYASTKAKNDANTAAGLNADGTSVTPITPDPMATGVTAAAGISLQAFNYLTQGTQSMSRMPPAQRNAIMKEANDFLNKNGLDVSTFQSQYKAQNQVVQTNIQRFANTQVASDEVKGTLNNLDATTLPTGVSNLNVANVAKIWAGQEVNDPKAYEYAGYLHELGTSLAYFYAAQQGKTSADIPDMTAAAETIKNGLAKGGIEGLRSFIDNTTTKMTKVAGDAVDSANKSVWNLFGVGAQYKTPAPQVSAEDAKNSVDSYVKSNPNEAESVAKLYEVPGATDSDIAAYLKAQGKLK